MIVQLAILFRVHPRELEGMDDRMFATIMDVLEETQR